MFLSGGLDSSVVAALLVQAGVKVRAYTLDFGDVGIPEHPYSEQVAQFLKIPLIKVAVFILFKVLVNIADTVQRI
ncbi:asparagine synthase-related protein [Nostoc sp.]|uniref:asparagine synthase-related protein n=1 Tax=Nostoc sp. TaxID=1180 RepID=UPI003FA5C1F0